MLLNSEECVDEKFLIVDTLPLHVHYIRNPYFWLHVHAENIYMCYMCQVEVVLFHEKKQQTTDFTIPYTDFSLLNLLMYVAGFAKQRAHECGGLYSYLECLMLQK